MRAFISIELPEKVKKEIVKIQKEIDSLGLIEGKFTELENLHLTLKFLGNISEVELRAVRERLKNIEFDLFELELEKIGVFSERFIRLVWVGLKGEKLFELQRLVDDLLSGLFPKEYRFMAHVTIARPKFIEDRTTFLQEIKKIEFNKLKFSVDKIFLKKSTLTPSGAIYTTLLEKNLLRKGEILVSN